MDATLYTHRCKAKKSAYHCTNWTITGDNVGRRWYEGDNMPRRRLTTQIMQVVTGRDRHVEAKEKRPMLCKKEGVGNKKSHQETVVESTGDT